MLKIDKLFPQIHYPVTKGKNGYFTKTYGKTSIKNQIITVLLTRIGERVHNVEFGSRIFELVFEQNDSVLDVLIRQYVIDAIQRWVTNIELITVTIYRNSNDPNSVNISLTYMIKKPVAQQDSTVLLFNNLESKLELIS